MSSLSQVELASSSSLLGVGAGGGGSGGIAQNSQHRHAPAPTTGAISSNFREIHKNTWLKRLNADGKKITVGPKKSECSWVVFCVHDDTEALLEGYAEPRQAAAHLPEWVVSLRDTLHISHALIPNSHEFEFVVTLANEVLRFHAVSWEIMQEWVETLRSKLREMKILSPRENLYTKLPEVRAPLLPTRDPTSPLPAPPPVPAAIVPGVERVVAAHQSINEQQTTTSRILETASTSTNSIGNNNNSTTSTAAVTAAASVAATTTTTTVPVATPHPTAMSNTLTQNLLNMLSDPISTYSEQINELDAPTDDGATESEELTADGQHSISNTDSEINLSDDEFLSPLLRKACVLTDNGLHVDVAATSAQRISADQILSLEHMLQCERLIPRPQTSRSMSAGAADKSKRITATTLDSTVVPTTSVGDANVIETITELSDLQDNITIIQVSNTSCNDLSKSPKELPPKLPPKSCTPVDIFRFPEINSKSKGKQQQQQKQQHHQQQEYKSNVQIIPSNSSTIQVLGQSNSNAYTMPVKTNASNTPITSTTTPSSNTTMVQVLCDDSSSSPAATLVAVYGTCYPTPDTNIAAAAAAITTTTVATKLPTPKLSKKIILSANSSGVTNISVSGSDAATTITGNVHYDKIFLSSSIPIASSSSSATTIAAAAAITESPRRQPTVPITSVTASTTEDSIQSQPSSSVPLSINSNSPALPPRRLASPPPVQKNVNRHVTRGLTELVISTRPSRRDFHYLKQLNTPIKTKATAVHKTPSAANNNIDIENGTTSSSSSANPMNRNNAAAIADSVEQRRRSSSTSDAQAPLQRHAGPAASQRGANNNEFTPGRSTGASAFRMQPPPQSNIAVAKPSAASPSKRLTLREQQVIQLRREIMHPGGVRLNLRRKDCVGSIAWVDAFGGVWIAGWKQKEHPVLYNALHIGDQLLSIASVSISSAAEANKIIRNTNTLFVEVLLRRIPFGRAYAIRREREGQCLGLIRDGNTSTIVDIVPNSLAARHGLPPKAQSCDGTTLTFWILTEINGRPLNLFFKDHEIRDRLNSVGTDISILVQPSDLIAKLKKQLKSLRGYKDYLVQ